MTALLFVLLAAIPTWCVLERGGGLAWDDADYLRRALTNVRLAESDGVLRRILMPVRLLDRTLLERPKPPWLVGWIEAGRLALGRPRDGDLTPLLVWSTILPWIGLLGLVAFAARTLAGRRAIVPALLATAASPLALAYGGKVMVETWLAVWVVLTLFTAARALRNPTPARLACLGAAIALAMLTKMTFPLLLAGPALVFLVVFFRRHGRQALTRRNVLALMLPILAIAGPWYIRNGAKAVKFAAYSSQYNIEAEGRTESIPRWDRLESLGVAVAGVPALLAVGVLAVRWRGRGGVRDYGTLALASGAVGTLVLLVPPYFDPRFLLPAWPALALAIGCAAARVGRPRRIAVGLLLTLGAVLSSREALNEPSAWTYPETSRWLDRLAREQGVRHLAQIGDCPDWNVCKTGLFNELRDDPASCSVLHEFSRVAVEDLDARLSRMDAVVLLDDGYLTEGFRAAAPGLNRAYEHARKRLEGNPAWTKLDRPTDLQLPPLDVYVRKATPSIARDVPSARHTR